jgi:phospholipase C
MRTLALALWTLVLAPTALAQQISTQHLPIQHVIIVVQENRTIDNLFANDPNLSGVHFSTTGLCGAHIAQRTWPICSCGSS